MNDVAAADTASPPQVVVVHMREARLDALLEHRPDDWTNRMEGFAEPVPSFDHSKQRAVLALIMSSPTEIRAVAVGHRGYAAGTGLSQIVLTDASLATTRTLDDVVETLPMRHRARTRAVLTAGGLLPPAASNELLRILAAESVAVAERVQRAVLLNENSMTLLAPRQQLRLQQERDAALTAMLIAGVNRYDALDYDGQDARGGEWFLSQVVNVRMREDPQIAHDATRFPMLAITDEHVSGAVRLEGNGVVLSIILINRQPLEELTGTDLIYFNETFDAFVMVQYKAMELEGEKHVFRLPDAQLASEVARMDAFTSDLGTDGNAGTAPHGFRLNDAPFFLKFCPRIVQDMRTADLVPGMYFPLAHWRRLQEAPLLHGPRGGVALQFSSKPPHTNADRYMTNSDFATLVRSGWIGTRVEDSTVLRRLIAETLASGRSVTFAHARDIPAQRP